jgi:hypothetical protein
MQVMETVCPVCTVVLKSTRKKFCGLRRARCWRVERGLVREFVLCSLPDIGPASRVKVLRALFNTYALLSVATGDDTALRFQVHAGTLPGFLYVLTAEFPEPGMYAFESREQGPMRRWLLWDRACLLWDRRRGDWLPALLQAFRASSPHFSGVGRAGTG